MKARRRILSILLLIYPVFAHIAIVLHCPEFALVFLITVMFGFYVDIDSSHRVRILVLGSITLILLFVFIVKQVFFIIYFYPIMVTFFFAWLFAKTLRPGREALISRFVKLTYNVDDPEIMRYTHNVTVVWTCFFFLMALETILLAMFAKMAVWSLFTNILNYVFIGLLFAIEYAYRRYRFGKMTSWKDFLYRLRHTNFAELARD